MPYSGAGDKSLPSNVKKMTTKKKKQWVAIFNETYNTCVGDGGSTDSCETKAFKAANGTVQTIEENSMGRGLLRKAWDAFLVSFTGEVNEQTQEIERAISFSRMREQLWDALENDAQTSDRWAWPIDIFVDNNNSLFAIVAQSGKLYQVAVTMSDETMSLGEWQQVTEVFQPVQQSRMSIKRQKDGKYRIVGVAATSVLNRVAQIDSVSLFDSFIEDVEQTGDWPTFDFYHMGKYGPEIWEFGTVDYHARDGYCYIVSGLLDDTHPLGRAAIDAYERDPEKWGFSIEFFAFGNPDVIMVNPEVRVPVYERGRIIRVSIVRECDAASLFTRIGNITEEKVRMKRDVQDALAEFFGTDDAAKKFLESFSLDVDGVNRTVEDDKLVHRATAALKKINAGETTTQAAEASASASQGQQDDAEDEPLVLDEAAIGELARQVAESPTFKAIAQSIQDLHGKIEGVIQARSSDSKEIAALKQSLGQANSRLGKVEGEESQKKQMYQQDMPARAGRRATFVPREQYADNGEEESTEVIAERTLAKIPSRRMYPGS